MRFCFPKPTVADHVKNRSGVNQKHLPTVISSEAEDQLGRLIKLMEEYCYGLSKKNVLLLVRNYIIEEKIPNPFKDNFPGEEWSSSSGVCSIRPLGRAPLLRIVNKV